MRLHCALSAEILRPLGRDAKRRFDTLVFCSRGRELAHIHALVSARDAKTQSRSARPRFSIQFMKQAGACRASSGRGLRYVSACSSDEQRRALPSAAVARVTFRFRVARDAHPFQVRSVIVRGMDADEPRDSESANPRNNRKCARNSEAWV